MKFHKLNKSKNVHIVTYRRNRRWEKKESMLGHFAPYHPRLHGAGVYIPIIITIVYSYIN